MKIKFSKETIEFTKELSALDTLVFDFTSILNRLGIPYVIISGYVSILFGRNRSSEDIDLFIEKGDFNVFKELWSELQKHFECIITENKEEAYNEYLLSGYALRFARKRQFIPNIEIKFPKGELEEWALQHRKKVVCNGNIIFISNLELQISFKLFLGSEKDLEDASYLYNLFKDNLDHAVLAEFNRKFNIERVFKEIR